MLCTAYCKTIKFDGPLMPNAERGTNTTPSIQALSWLILTDTQHIVRAEGFTISELDERIEEITTE